MNKRILRFSMIAMLAGLSFQASAQDCDGMPTAGNVGVTDAQYCTSGNSTLSLSGYTAGDGITIQWESSPAGEDSWSTIVGATDAVYEAMNQTSSTDYRALVTCTNSSESAYSDVGTVTILTPHTPTVSAASDDMDNIICDGSSITFNATADDAGDSPTYQWYVNSGIISGATDASYTSTSIANGDNVTVIVTSSDECTTSPTAESDPQTITVNSTVTPMISISAPGLICYLTNSTFTTSGSDLGSAPAYSWFRNGAILDGESLTSLMLSNISKMGDTISVTVSNIDATCATSTEVSNTVVVHALDNPDPNTTYITASGSTKLCEGNEVTFTAKSSHLTGASFVWNKDGNPISGETNTTYTTDQPGAISLTVTSQEGCTRTSTARVINALPEATVSVQGGGDASFCTGSFVNLEAASVSGASYRWKLDGVNKGTSTVQKAQAAGSYTVTVTKNSCAATSAPVAVTENTTDVSISIGGDLTFCTPRTTTLSAVSNPAYTYQWYKGSTLLADETHNSFTTGISGSYRVSIQNGTCPAKKSAITVVTANATPVATISRTTKQTAFWTLRGNPGGTGYSYQWYLGGSAISGATNRDYNAVADGSYTVLVSKEMCSDTSDAYVVLSSTFRGVAVAEEAVAISIFPNPSTGIFNIGSEQPVNAIVKDVQGRIVADVKNAASVDLSNQAPGMYIMSITDAAGKLLQAERVVKQ